MVVVVFVEAMAVRMGCNMTGIQPRLTDKEESGGRSSAGKGGSGIVGL